MILPWIAGLLVALAATVGIGSKLYFTQLKDDNIIEEICEDIIEHQTGFDIDLSPFSSEKDKDENIS